MASGREDTEDSATAESATSSSAVPPVTTVSHQSPATSSSAEPATTSSAEVPSTSTSTETVIVTTQKTPEAPTGTTATSDDDLPAVITGAVGRGARRREPMVTWRHRRNSDSRRNEDIESDRNVDANRRYRAKPMITQQIKVPSKQVGRVIGKGGNKIKELQYETGVKIKVGDSDGTNTEISIYGAETDVAICILMINKLIEKPSVYYHSAAPRQQQRQQRRFLQDSDDDDDAQVLSQHNKKKSPPDKAAEAPPPPPVPPRVVKDFYVEDPKVKNMSAAEVTRWRKINFNIRVRRIFEERPDLRPIPNPVMTFEQASKKHSEIFQDLRCLGYGYPAPIQAQGWPILLRGEDLVLIGPTGSGKTLTFLVPAFIHMEAQKKQKREGPAVLIMTPSRTLALQVQKEIVKYFPKDVKTACLYSGGDRQVQFKEIEDGADIVIATLGRLNDLLINGDLNMNHFSFIVIDAVDIMVGIGFESQIRQIMPTSNINKQLVFTCSSWTVDAENLAKIYMKDPIEINVGISLVMDAVKQVVIVIDEDKKIDTLMQRLKVINRKNKIIVLCRTQEGAADVSNELAMNGIDCQLMPEVAENCHGEDSEDTLHDRSNILVVSDLASMCDAIKYITYAINYDFPHNIEEYNNMLGRIISTSKTGTVVSFMTRRNWIMARDLVKLLDDADQEVPLELEHMARQVDALELKKSTDRERSRGDCNVSGAGATAGRNVGEGKSATEDNNAAPGNSADKGSIDTPDGISSAGPTNSAGLGSNAAMDNNTAAGSNSGAISSATLVSRAATGSYAAVVTSATPVSSSAPSSSASAVGVSGTLFIDGSSIGGGVICGRSANKEGASTGAIRKSNSINVGSAKTGGSNATGRRLASEMASGAFFCNRYSHSGTYAALYTDSYYAGSSHGSSTHARVTYAGATGGGAVRRSSIFSDSANDAGSPFARVPAEGTGSWGFGSGSLFQRRDANASIGGSYIDGTNAGATGGNAGRSNAGNTTISGIATIVASGPFTNSLFSGGSYTIGPYGGSSFSTGTYASAVGGGGKSAACSSSLSVATGDSANAQGNSECPGGASVHTDTNAGSTFQAATYAAALSTPSASGSGGSAGKGAAGKNRRENNRGPWNY